MGSTHSLIFWSEFIKSLYNFSAFSHPYHTLRCVYILRNFKKVNKFHLCPTLFALYIIGPRLSILIIIEINNIIGDAMMINMMDANISIILLNMIDRQSNLECLYSKAIILSMFSGI
ncbi:MAG: hypothetical protein WCG25_06690 [bacterium]